MPPKTPDAPLPVNKIVDLGIIDNWLRGVACMVPAAKPGRDRAHPAPAPDPGQAGLALAPDFNVHMLEYDSHDCISHAEIESLVGCRQLLRACSRNDVRVDLVDHGQGRLKLTFNPAAPFASSRLFDNSYADTLPALLGGVTG